MASAPGETRGAPLRAGFPGLRQALATRPVLVVATAVVAVLLWVAGQYGFHRDELYFIVAGRHPDWGYVDQPPLTPLLAIWQIGIFGLSPAADRILPALAIGIVVVIGALTAREFGGGRSAQIVAAGALAAATGILASGHLQSTETFDILTWSVVLWLAARLLRGADCREWLLLGAVAGIGLENKNLVVLLGLGLAAGLVLARRWDLLRSRWLWSAPAIAGLIWLPNLIWQASHGWPQLEMARSLAAGGASENRAMLLPIQLLATGPAVLAVVVVGLVWLLRLPRAAPWRAIGWAYPVLLLVLFVLGAKGYYVAGLFVPLTAAGAVRMETWLTRRPMRTVAFAAALAANGVLTAPVVLPIVPVAQLGSTPIPALFKESAEQVGWPELVAEVAGVAASVSPGDRSRLVILTANYGEAGAITLLGPSFGLPAAYSGHNSFADWGPPPEIDGPVIVVGFDRAAYLAEFFGRCDLAATIDNRLGVANQEQSEPIWLCHDRRAPWADLWPRLHHLD